MPLSDLINTIPKVKSQIITKINSLGYKIRDFLKEKRIEENSLNPNSTNDQRGIDIRSLGLFRITFGLVLIHNLYLRLSDRGLNSFFSQEGLVPIEYSNPFSYSLLNSIVGLEVTIIFMIASLIVYILYTIGYKTNIMKWLVVLVLLTLFHRVRFITDGSDMMLRLIAIWTAFLPLGRRLSIDSYIEKKKYSRLATGNYISYPLILLLLNLSISYALNALQKDFSVWSEGLAVKRVFWDGWVINPLGAWIRNYTPDAIFSLLSEATILIELTIAIVIFAAIFGNLGKILSVTLILALHGGFALFMYIGSFTWLYCPIALLFVPSFIWNNIKINNLNTGILYYKLIDRKKFILPTIFGIYSLTALLAFNHIFPKTINESAEKFLYGPLKWINQPLVIGQQWFMYMSPENKYILPVLEVIDENGKAFDFLRDREIYNDYFVDIHKNPKNMGKYWVSYCFQSWGHPYLREPLLKHLNSLGYKTIRWIDTYQEISDSSANDAQGFPKYSSKVIFEVETPEVIDIGTQNDLNKKGSIQTMDPYGKRWLNNNHLLVLPAQSQPPPLTIEVSVPERISKMNETEIPIDLILTNGPDFGIFEINQEGSQRKIVTNLFNPTHVSTTTIRTSIERDKIRDNKLRFEVNCIGKSPRSTGNMFGIDQIVINPWSFN
jgi:hypothetical protein